MGTMRPKHYKLLRPFGPGVFQINTHECSIYLQMDVTGLPELGEKDGLESIHLPVKKDSSFLNLVSCLMVIAFRENCYSTFSNLQRVVEIECSVLGNVV